MVFYFKYERSGNTIQRETGKSTRGESGCANRDPGRPGSRFRFHDNLDILAEGELKTASVTRPKKTLKLIMQQGGDLGLIDFERSRGSRPGKVRVVRLPVDRSSEAGFGVELSRIGQPHISKDIPAARYHSPCGFFSPMPLLVVPLRHFSRSRTKATSDCLVSTPRGDFF